MQINIKFKATLITFMLIVSSLSFFIIPPQYVKADNGNNFEDLLLLISGFHPYVTAGWYEYYGNESLQIEGDVKFNLYFSSTLSTQTRWKDDIEISIYTLNTSLFPQKIENGNTTITLEHELFGETVQRCNVTLEDINYTLSDGDILLFTVEIIQSDKPIGNIIEKRYEDKLKDPPKGYKYQDCYDMVTGELTNSDYVKNVDRIRQELKDLGLPVTKSV